jgi:sugar O-acyltransferase (sialic acid O-acetyltransferase NeuD family)
MGAAMQGFVIIGGGGHAKVLISLLHKLASPVLGYVDDDDRGAILGAIRLGGDAALAELLAAHTSCSVAMGVGKVDASTLRSRLLVDAAALGFRVPSIVSPDAVVNEEVRLGDGTVVFDGSCVNSGVVVGPLGILNTNSTVEHDCRLGENVHVGPGATLSGGVTVGEHTMIGAGATVIHGVAICAGCLVGAGAVVVEDVTESGVYTGVPARRVR